MPGRTRPRSDHGQPMLDPRAAARLLDVSVRTIYNMLASGRLKGYKVGGTAVRIKCEDLDALLVDYPQAQR
jgi:excisionase family DNA binding protein